MTNAICTESDYDYRALQKNAHIHENVHVMNTTGHVHLDENSFRRSFPDNWSFNNHAQQTHGNSKDKRTQNT